MRKTWWQQIRKALADLHNEAKGECLERIVNIMWPDGDTDHEWDADTTSDVAAILQDYGLHVDNLKKRKV